jgi:hypothetical protein
MTWVRGLLALALVGVFLGLAPFAAALEIHHELAAADGDGHQHSDFDLCQWVQQHTGNSLLVVAPVAVSTAAAGSYHYPEPPELISARSASSTSSRAPPVL